MACSSLIFLWLVNYLFTWVVGAPAVNKSDPAYWGIKGAKNDDLTKKTLALKQQALKIISLRGGGKFDETKVKNTKAVWDDMQMTDDLASNLKATFDEEQKKLEDAIKYPNDTTKNRATAPDFALIPFAKWSNMPIPYSVALIRTSKLRNMVHDAVKELQDKTGGCIAFREVDDRPSSSFIAYREVPSLGPGVCADSPLGRQSDVNVINVATSCQVFGTLIHETMHSLGFAHTQQRPDVEQYLTINWRNIDPAAAPNFKPWRYALKDQGPFDYGSILMYPRTAFAINPYKDTLTPKRDPDHNGDLMGQRERLSDEDVNILKKIYCADGGSSSSSGGEVFVNLLPQRSGYEYSDRHFSFQIRPCEAGKFQGYTGNSMTRVSLHLSKKPMDLFYFHKIKNLCHEMS